MLMSMLCLVTQLICGILRNKYLRAQLTMCALLKINRMEILTVERKQPEVFEAIKLEEGRDNIKEALIFCHFGQTVEERDIKVCQENKGIVIWDHSISGTVLARYGDYILRSFNPETGQMRKYVCMAEEFDNLYEVRE